MYQFDERFCMQKNTTDIKPHMGRITSVMRIAAKNVCKV